MGSMESYPAEGRGEERPRVDSFTASYGVVASFWCFSLHTWLVKRDSVFFKRCEVFLGFFTPDRKDHLLARSSAATRALGGVKDQIVIMSRFELWAREECCRIISSVQASSAPELPSRLDIFFGKLLPRRRLASILCKRGIRERKTYRPHHLHCVHPRPVAHQPLPFGHPACIRISERDHTLEDCARTVRHDVRLAAHFEERLAVGAALRGEFGKGLADGADHAGAPGAEGGHVDVVSDMDSSERRKPMTVIER
nr:hypothetical protein CFP56_79115 [Quercus suber]